MKHSITLYGFGYHYMRGEYTLEDVLKKTKKLGAQGFEIVAPQMVEGHPNPSEYWMESFKELYHKYDLEPVCYSIYIDSGKHKGRFLNEAERLTGTINEMEYAKKMGFSVVRSQDALLAERLWKSCSLTREELGLHSGHRASRALFSVHAYIPGIRGACLKRKIRSHLGVVMDYSAFTSGPPATVLDQFPG